MGDVAGRAHRRTLPTTGSCAGGPARPDRNPAADRPGVRRRRYRAYRTRSFTVKPIHLIGVLALVLSLAACGSHSNEDGHGHEGTDEHAGAEAPEQGAHGGRLLKQDGYAVELAIAEDGTPPKYQAWLYKGDAPLPATAGTVEVRLTRLGNVAANHRLEPMPDASLMAESVVGEPPSFDVEVLADRKSVA